MKKCIGIKELLKLVQIYSQISRNFCCAKSAKNGFKFISAYFFEECILYVLKEIGYCTVYGFYCVLYCTLSSWFKELLYSKKFLYELSRQIKEK